jgi:hypothetical protein
MFLTLIAGGAAPCTLGIPAAVQTQAIELKAFVAAHLPQTAVLRCDARMRRDADAIYELRSYERTVPHPDLLARHRLTPILSNGDSILLSFPNLTERERAWNELTADEEWKRSPHNVTRISLYKEV